MAENIDKEMIKEFQVESSNLIDQMTNILERCEGDFSQVLSLENYGQTVDRIMGGAKSISVQIHNTNPLIEQVGDYAAICKAVGYKASQIKDNEEFYNICVAFLLDATEVLENLVGHVVDNPHANLKDFVTQTFIDRLKWVSNQFGTGFRASVDIHKGMDQRMSQAEIDNLLKKLGLD